MAFGMTNIEVFDIQVDFNPLRSCRVECDAEFVESILFALQMRDIEKIFRIMKISFGC